MLPERVPDQRLLTGVAATLKAKLRDADGNTDTTVSSGVTITVTRLDGTAIATDAAATAAAGVLTYALTAAQTGAGLDLLTAEWTYSSEVAVTTYHEIVGRHWFAPNDLYDIPGVQKALGSYPPDVTAAQALIDARNWAETLIEWSTGVAWVPRTAYESLDARGREEVVLSCPLPRTLRALTIDGATETLTDWKLERHGTLRRLNGGEISTLNARGLVVWYDHGADAPPAPLLEAAKKAAANRILERSSQTSWRLTGMTSEGATVSFARTDRDHPTGLPDVDAVIMQCRMRPDGIA